MNLSEIKTNPNNPRVIKDARFKQLKKSIEDLPHMMVLRPIVVDETGTVLGGNMRLEALKSLGYKEVPDDWVKRTDELSEEQKKEFVIKDNAGFGEWDWDQLANEWSEYPLADWGVDVPAEWNAKPLEEDELAVAEMIDKAAELQKKWKVERGQIWEIGRHRLMCGDSTTSNDVGRLLGDARPVLMATDPPYGVELDTEWRERAGISAMGEQSAKGLEWDANADWTKALELSPADIAYVWHADRFIVTCGQALKTAGYELKQQIIWNKSVAPFGRAHYHWKHEPCWYAVRKGKTANWQAGADQVTVWDDASPRHIMGGSAEEKQPHPTQKPISIYIKPIENHTTTSDSIYEPFTGSGTAFAAAEQIGRPCYGMEIDPKYCAVTLERLSALGLTPRLTEGKQ